MQLVQYALQTTPLHPVSRVCHLTCNVWNKFSHDSWLPAVPTCCTVYTTGSNVMEPPWECDCSCEQLETFWQPSTTLHLKLLNLYTAAQWQVNPICMKNFPSVTNQLLIPFGSTKLSKALTHLFLSNHMHLLSRKQQEGNTWVNNTKNLIHHVDRILWYVGNRDLTYNLFRTLFHYFTDTFLITGLYDYLYQSILVYVSYQYFVVIFLKLHVYQHN